MPEFDPATMLALAALLAALAAVALAITARHALALGRREAEQREQALRGELELLRQSIRGLTAGAVGLDRRVRRVEARERVLAERQETYEIQHSDEQPYGQAIRLVHQGAGVHRLVDELALSESEAQLIVRLHGARDTA